MTQKTGKWELQLAWTVMASDEGWLRLGGSDVFDQIYMQSAFYVLYIYICRL